MDHVGDVLQLVGAALVVAGAFVLAVWLGLIVAGVAAVAVGFALNVPRPSDA